MIATWEAVLESSKPVNPIANLTVHSNYLFFVDANGQMFAMQVNNREVKKIVFKDSE